MNVYKEIDKIINRWFITEPIFFMTQCMFRLTPNDSITKFAVDTEHLYVNMNYAETLTPEKFEEHLKAEYLRILLRHPFNRRTDNMDKEIAFIASECVLSDNVVFNHIDVVKSNLFTDNKRSNIKLSYEELYKLINKKLSDVTKSIPNDSIASNSEERKSATKYWGYDQIAISKVNRLKEHIIAGKNAGSISAGLIEKIIAEDTPIYDYKEALRCFRHSVISSNKKLTRMRPNRRYGYEQMGRIPEYSSNILIVCDASGSMTNEILNKFLGFCNGFFRFGVKTIDIVTFDTVVYDNSLTTLKRKTYEFECHGRGGTDIYDILEYVNNRSKKKYDGVIVFTDGCFPFNAVKWSSEARGVNYIFCVISEDSFENRINDIDKINSNNLKITYIDIDGRDS